MNPSSREQASLLALLSLTQARKRILFILSFSAFHSVKALARVPKGV